MGQGLIQNLDLLSVGIVVAATVILGFVVFFNNRNSATNRSFLAFSLVTGVWGVINYLNYQVPSPYLALWLLRFSIFLACWQAYCLFCLFYIFPQEKARFPKFFTHYLTPLVIATSFLTLTRYVFTKVAAITAEGQISQITNGPGIILFGTTSVGLVLSGIFILLKKVLKAGKDEKKSLLIILIGTFLTFALIIIFNFILPAFFSNARFVSLGAVFIFPFILFTSYSIFKHRLLDIKIVSTEILTFVLAIAMLFEVILSNSALMLVFRFSVFLLILGVGVLLIRSVLKEVKQREELQVLTKKLENANQQLKALDQARAEFISIASHQLRTPPATIKWYLAAILSGDYGPLDKGVKEVLRKAERTNNLLIALVEDLLNVSRIERGKMEFYFEPVDIQELVQVTFEQLQPLAQEKGLELTYKKPLRKLPKLMADKEKIRQVINNLIDNAIKYTRHGMIMIGLDLTPKNEIRFTVTDTGKGIDPANINTVFEKFTRGRNSVHESTGLGLGLYVAKIIIEQHHGKIWAESPGEGKGSTFAFVLPVENNLKATTILDLAEHLQPQKDQKAQNMQIMV